MAEFTEIVDNDDMATVTTITVTGFRGGDTGHGGFIRVKSSDGDIDIEIRGDMEMERFIAMMKETIRLHEFMEGK